MNTSGKSSGWVNLNGLLIQWGYIKTTDTTIVVTFPKPFSNTNYTGVGTPSVTSNNTSDLTITERNTNNMTITCHVKKELSPYWFAIGF